MKKANREMMRGERWIVLGALAAACVLFPSRTHAALADLSLTQSQITFSQSTLYAGDVVRIYARVRNLGETDIVATVFFYQGSELIASAQPISLAAEGAPEEVFVDFTVPNGSFNIRAVIQGSEPADENAFNNEATTPLYTSVQDADRDGTEDEDDNCEDESNTSQQDTDSDGAGDACDTDDDGDGVSDSNERSAGTNALDSDTDGDGMDDDVDPSPLVIPEPETAPAQEEVVVISAPVSAPTDIGSARTTQSVAAAAPVEETEDVGIAAPTRAYGVLNISPRAYFSYMQFDWNTFGFEVQSPQDGMTYAWDFGDGSSSALPAVHHDYDGPGMFTVALTTRDAAGNEDVDIQVVTVSFFSLQNPWVQALLGFCVALLAALGVLLVAMRRERESDHV